MSRCKACNTLMNEAELALTNTQSGEPEDLCFNCLGHANDAVLELEGDEQTPAPEQLMYLTEREIDNLIDEYDLPDYGEDY